MRCCFYITTTLFHSLTKRGFRYGGLIPSTGRWASVGTEPTLSAPPDLTLETNTLLSTVTDPEMPFPVLMLRRLLLSVALVLLKDEFVATMSILSVFSPKVECVFERLIFGLDWSVVGLSSFPLPCSRLSGANPDAATSFFKLCFTQFHQKRCYIVCETTSVALS